MNFRTFFSFSFAALLLACTNGPPIPTQTVIGVSSFTVEHKNLPVVFDFIGFAESSHPVEIRAKVEGYLDDIAYTEGELVHAGDLLFQLDPKQYQAKVEQAKGEVAKQTAILENAKTTVNRLKPLYEHKAASKKDLDNATSEQLSSEASLMSARANLLDLEINLSYTTIRSPLTGLADKSKYRQGALINPGSNSLLTTVSVLDPIWVYFTVSEGDILRARNQASNQKMILPKEYDVELILSDGSTYPYRGKVSFSAPTYDQSTGTLLVRAVFPNPTGNSQLEPVILPGQFVRVKVYGAERPDALLVPRRALLQKKGGQYVFLIDKDNKVVAQDVSTGEWHGDYQIVTNGLKTGDKIVVDGINKVSIGSDVHIDETWKPPVGTQSTSS